MRTVVRLRQHADSRPAKECASAVVYSIPTCESRLHRYGGRIRSNVLGSNWTPITAMCTTDQAVSSQHESGSCRRMLWSCFACLDEHAARQPSSPYMNCGWISLDVPASVSSDETPWQSLQCAKIARVTKALRRTSAQFAQAHIVIFVGLAKSHTDKGRKPSTSALMSKRTNSRSS